MKIGDHLKTAFLSIVPVAFCYLISLRVSQDYFFSGVVKNTQRFLFPAMCLIRTGRLSFSSNLESGTIKDASLFMAPSHTKTKKQNKNHFFKLPFLWQQRLSETQCWGGGGWGGGYNFERDITTLYFVLGGNLKSKVIRAVKSLLPASIQLSIVSAERRLVFSL